MLIAIVDGLMAKAVAERYGVDVDEGERLTGFKFTKDKVFHVYKIKSALVLRLCLPRDDGHVEADPPVRLGAWTAAVDDLLGRLDGAVIDA